MDYVKVHVSFSAGAGLNTIMQKTSNFKFLIEFVLGRCVVCADYHLCHSCFATDTHTQHSFQFRQVSQATTFEQ